MPLDLEQTLDQASSLIENNLVENATALLIDLLKENPDNPGALLLLGGAYMAANNLINAEKVFDRLVSIDPGRGEYSLALLNALLLQEQGDRAIDEINRFLSVADQAKEKEVVERYASIINKLAASKG